MTKEMGVESNPEPSTKLDPELVVELLAKQFIKFCAELGMEFGKELLIKLFTIVMGEKNKSPGMAGDGWSTMPGLMGRFRDL